MALNLLSLVQEPSSLIFLFGSCFYCNALSVPFVHLPLMGRKQVICDLKSVGIKCAFLVCSDTENLKTWNLRCFFKVLWDLRWRIYKRPIFHQTKICKYENTFVLQEIFLIYPHSMHSKYRVIFTNNTEESISLRYSCPFLNVYIY